MDNVMSSPGPLRRSADDEVAEKVLRRARVSKMARALQDRLTLANIKIKHGWQHRSIDSLEPEIDRELKRKRDQAQLDLFSDTSSNVSGPFSNGVSASSPLSAPIFSDDLPRSGSSQGSNKRFRMDPPILPSAVGLGPRTLTRSQSRRPAAASWKSSYQLPESSPSFRRTTRLAETERASYSSETSTIVDDSPSGSEEDEEDIPIHSFQLEPMSSAPPALASSPPRTPPPSLSRAVNLRPTLFSSAASQDHGDEDDDDSRNPGKEGADLLLYLASSPSPAVPLGRSDFGLAPSTPPTRTTPLPSSMMHTPGTQMFWGAPNTPGTAGFNFADFINVTPSPAQVPWNKTPGTVKTPKAKTPAAATRRRLNFDNLMPPPMHSPNLSSTPRSGRRIEGFGLELGGELTSSQ